MLWAMTDDTLPRISSFVAPTEADRKAFDSLSDEDKRAMLLAELKKGSKGRARKMSLDEILTGLRPPRDG